jgi:hypothetical protein
VHGALPEVAQLLPRLLLRVLANQQRLNALGTKPLAQLLAPVLAISEERESINQLDTKRGDNGDQKERIESIHTNKEKRKGIH